MDPEMVSFILRNSEFHFGHGMGWVQCCVHWQQYYDPFISTRYGIKSADAKILPRNMSVN